jgi:Flp pilus assembly protein TadG
MTRHLSRIALQRDESGAVLVMVTISMVVLLLLAGLVIDLGGVKTYRADQQSISDAAASAGAISIAKNGDGQQACEAARQYVIINSDAINSLAGIDCSSFATACDDTTPEVTETGADNGYTVSLTYPVDSASPLMASQVMGALPQPASPEDGDRCDRFAVAISSDYSTGFVRLAGYDTLAANVHTVAKSFIPEGEDIPINLLVLDRFGCETIQVGGSGSAGIIIGAIVAPDVDPVTPGDQPGLIPGLAAADSDASAGCGSGNGVIDIDGSNGTIRADGPEGCAGQTGTHPRGGFIAGEGCGLVRVVAPGTPGCNFPACTSASPGNPNPDPTSLPRRLTRAPADYLWNCKTEYDQLDPQLAWATEPLTAANEQDIPDCDDDPAPHIDDLIRTVGSSGMPSGFMNRWTDHFSCSIPSSDPPIVVSGNWWVDCASLSLNATVAIQGGNVVFDGGVDIRASGVLSVDNSLGSPGWVVLRGGQLKKAGQGTLILRNTAVYASRHSSVAMAGGSGGLTWIAPDSGAFKDLALWSDSASVHSWSGQANLDMRGVFFTPLATANYSGGAGQNQVQAQFIADKLNASGNGALVVAPEFGNSVRFPVEPQSTLLR